MFHVLDYQMTAFKQVKSSISPVRTVITSIEFDLTHMFDLISLFLAFRYALLEVTTQYYRIPVRTVRNKIFIQIYTEHIATMQNRFRNIF